MTLNDADNYHWIEEWDGSRERTTESLSGWAHPGMAVTENQRIVTCDSGESSFLLKGSWNIPGSGTLRMRMVYPL